MSAPKYKEFVEDHILTEDELSLKRYIPGYRVQPARGRIPEKYIYRKEVLSKTAMNELTGAMATTTFFNGIPPVHPLQPPPYVPYNPPFVLHQPTLKINNEKRRNIHEAVVATYTPPVPGYNHFIKQFGRMNMTDGGRRRKSRRNLKKKTKKTHRRRK